MNDKEKNSEGKDKENVLKIQYIEKNKNKNDSRHFVRK